MIFITYDDFCYLMLLLMKQAVLWMEMILDETLVLVILPWNMIFCTCMQQSNIWSFVKLDPLDIVLDWMPQAIQKVVTAGFGKVNLNVECLSTWAVERCELGAILMKNINAVVELLQTMHNAMAAVADGVDSGGIGNAIPISIKVCIAVNDCDLEEFLESFVKQLVDKASCQHFYLHACKVYTNGLYNPSQNCNIPPLDYPCNIPPLDYPTVY